MCYAIQAFVLARLASLSGCVFVWMERQMFQKGKLSEVLFYLSNRIMAGRALGLRLGPITQQLIPLVVVNCISAVHASCSYPLLTHYVFVLMF